MTDSTSQVLGPYHLLDEIGSGGMATVYRAYDTRSGRLVALKVLSPHRWHDPELVERFRREAHHAAGLQHPHIAPVYESGVVEDHLYLAMAYVEGGSLADRLAWQQGPLPLPRAAEILDQVAAALDYAHTRGLVHRDVKPSNILLTHDGHAMLTDFGIAKAAWDSRLTQTGVRMGTPAYMAPEQARGRPVDARTDVYALGVVVYELSTGRPPFQGNTDAVLYQHVHESPPPPRQLNPALPQAAERAIMWALAKDPARRPRTAGALAAAFRRAVEPPTQVAKPGAAPPPVPTGRGRPVTLTRRALAPDQIVALAAALGATLLVVALALGLSRSGLVGMHQPTSTPTPTASPTATPTSTATPTASPTATPTSTPTPTATPLPAPELTGPDDGAAYYAWQEVTLAWTYSPTLEADQHFVVAIEENGTQVLTATVGAGGEMAYPFKPADVGLGVGTYRWTVWVEQEVEGIWEEIAPPGAGCSFRVLPPPTPTLTLVPPMDTPRPPADTPTPVSLRLSPEPSSQRE